ncbi:MAG: PEP/pyruvate-binding domain-containing protein [Limisphaerales bacterium]
MKTKALKMNTSAVLVLRLEEAGDNRLSLVGGKAFNLGRLITAGLPVPRGFCVTTTAFDLFPGWQVHAFCLMSNHFHLVVAPPSPTWWPE